MEARYQYEFVEVAARGRDRMAIRETVTEYAELGWRLVQILGGPKGPVEIVFERPIPDDAYTADLAVPI